MNVSLEEMLAMLEDLVNIDSGSHDKSGVDQVGSYLKERYKALGFTVIEKEHHELGNSLIMRHQYAEEPKVLILAHLDTVFPQGTVSERPFTIKDQYAYGPGVIDMKASHVMLYFAVKELVNKNHSSCKNIEIVLNSDEEIGTTTSRAIIEDRAKDKACALVLEPARADGSIVSARRGVGDYTLEIRGKAAHAGIEPDKGSSAIEELAHKTLKLHALSDREANLNVNVGLIEGGTSINTVAPIAKAAIDVRISTIEQGKWIDAKIKEICQRSDVPGTALYLSGGIDRPPMMFTDEAKTLVDIIQEESRQLGMDISHIATGGGSDASFTAAMGIPTVDGLGPVGGKQHSKDEFLEIDSLPERTKLFMNVLKKLDTTCQ